MSVETIGRGAGRRPTISPTRICKSRRCAAEPSMPVSPSSSCRFGLNEIHLYSSPSQQDREAWLDFAFPCRCLRACRFRQPGFPGDDLTVFRIVKWRVMHARDLLGLLGGAAQSPADTGGEIFRLILWMLTFHDSSFWSLWPPTRQRKRLKYMPRPGARPKSINRIENRQADQ